MNKAIISLALGASALFATAASAAPLANGIAVMPDNGIENVRMVCDQYGRCWRDRGSRRVIIQDSNSADIMMAGTMAGTTITGRASGSALGRVG
jgi:hypothetical protein